MDYNGYKKKIDSFPSIQDYTDDEETRNFYSLIDGLEEAAKTDPKFYGLIAGCYEQVLDYKKAKEAFMKIYNPSDKKHLKKLYLYNNMEFCPVTRPENRAEHLPAFKYTDNNVIKNLFIKDYVRKCCVCGNKSDAFYIGMYITADGNKKACYMHEDKIICASCLHNGNAARHLDISFNSTYINGLELIDKTKREELIKNTPSCSYLFENFCEDAWPICCNDFCCYQKREIDTFYFNCLHCGKEIKIN